MIWLTSVFVLLVIYSHHHAAVGSSAKYFLSIPGKAISCLGQNIAASSAFQLQEKKDLQHIIDTKISAMSHLNSGSSQDEIQSKHMDFFSALAKYLVANGNGNQWAVNNKITAIIHILQNCFISITGNANIRSLNKIKDSIEMFKKEAELEVPVQYPLTKTGNVQMITSGTRLNYRSSDIKSTNNYGSSGSSSAINTDSVQYYAAVGKSAKCSLSNLEEAISFKSCLGQKIGASSASSAFQLQEKKDLQHIIETKISAISNGSSQDERRAKHWDFFSSLAKYLVAMGNGNQWAVNNKTTALIQILQNCFISITGNVNIRSLNKIKYLMEMFKKEAELEVPVQHPLTKAGNVQMITSGTRLNYRSSDIKSSNNYGSSGSSGAINTYSIPLSLAISEVVVSTSV